MTEQTPVFKIDASCVKAGGDRGGAYLDAIGITDLAKLNPAQYQKFAGLVVAAAFSKAMDGWIEGFGCNADDTVPF